MRGTLKAGCLTTIGLFLFASCLALATSPPTASPKKMTSSPTATSESPSTERDEAEVATSKSPVRTRRPTQRPRRTERPSSVERRYATCAEAKRHGLGPYIRGTDLAYYWYQDRDKDGVVCE